MKKAGLKWTPATPIRKPDNLVSSKARENGEVGFKPSYETGRENMNFIMSMEYMRMWFKERATYEIDTYSKLEVEAGAKEIKRRIVQRDLTKKKPGNVLPPIKRKRLSKEAEKNKPKKEHQDSARKDPDKDAV